MNEKEGIYIAFDLSDESQDKLLSFLKSQGLDPNLAFSKHSTHLHATLFSSKESLTDEEYDNTLNKLEPLINFNYDIKISPKNLSWIALVNTFIDNNNPNEKPIRSSVLALNIQSNFIDSLHNYIKTLTGLTYNREKFNNHISLNFNYKGSPEELEKLKQIDFDLSFKPKIFIKRYKNDYSNSSIKIINNHIETTSKHFSYDKNNVPDFINILSVKDKETIEVSSDRINSIHDLLNLSKAKNLTEYHTLQSEKNEKLETSLVVEDTSIFKVTNNYKIVNDKNRPKPKKDKDPSP